MPGALPYGQSLTNILVSAIYVIVSLRLVFCLSNLKSHAALMCSLQIGIRANLWRQMELGSLLPGLSIPVSPSIRKPE